MKKYTFLLIGCYFVISSLKAQNKITETIQVFPYQKTTEANAALTAMSQWEKNSWKKFFKLFTDTNYATKATFALHAYVNKIANTPEKELLAKKLATEIKKTKSAYAKIALQDELNLLTDVQITNARNHNLPPIQVEKKQIKSTANNVQQRLNLQDQMELAKNPIEQKRILAQVAKIPGFSSFIMASKYLDNPVLNQDAALIVTRLALADISIKGKVVRTALEKALPLIRGVDSAILVDKLRVHLKKLPYDFGFESMFNEKDLTGWKGLVGNPIYRSKQTDSALKALQLKADASIKNDWIVKEDLLVFTGHGDNLCTEKKYGDFEMFVDWKITAEGDAGIYLRGTPQIQIWDTSRRDVGAEVGSGGLYNNQKNSSKPLVVADNAIGEWNNFHIIMQGDKVTVYLNGILVTDQVLLENYWDRSIPIFIKEQIELQAHGTYVAYRNLYIRELPSTVPNLLTEEAKKEGYLSLFDGSNLDAWMGNKASYTMEDGAIVVDPTVQPSGNLYTKETYENFQLNFEFQLTPGANNGIGIRTPLEGDAAYLGMEIQVLDNEAPIYSNLQAYQYHGSVYGVIPAKRGFLKPVGEWNQESIVLIGSKIKVYLNGTLIVDGDIKEASKNGTLDHQLHPGLDNKKGHIGLLTHGDVVRFKNISIKKLK